MTEKQSADLDKFKAVLDTYGARRDTWPATEQALMEQLLASSDVARSLLRQEEKFDQLLASNGPMISAPSALLSRVLVDAEEENRGSIWHILWPFGSIWQPASGLAMAACIGAVIGLTTPEILSNGDELAYDEPAFGDTLFDLEYENGSV